MAKLSTEALTLEAMVALACRRGRHGPEVPCPACRDLLDYALGRLVVCPYGQAKPTCLHCPIHCYAPDRRAAIRQVMRNAGPWMLFSHPWLSLRHFLRF